MNSTSQHRQFSLEANMFSWKNVFVPLGVGVAVLTLGVILALLLGKGNREAFDVLMMFGLVGGTTGFLLARKRLAATKTLQLDHDTIDVVKEKNKEVVARARISDTRIRNGYFLVATRFAQGYCAALTVEFPGGPTLSITAKDYAHYYYWEGDDPWRKTYSRPRDLPSPTAYVTADAFLSIAQALVKNDTLIQKAIGT